MSNPDKKKMMQEYGKKFFTTFRILEVTGFCRFIIRNGEIVERNWVLTIYNVFVMIVADAAALAILETANQSKQTLSAVEFGTIVYFSIFSNVFLFHITFSDKYTGSNLIRNCIDIDYFLGTKETEFLRALTTKIYTFLFLLIGCSQVLIVSYMYYIFDVSIAIHVLGTCYFYWIFFAYDDYCFLLFNYMFLSTRARYLNVALLKHTGMKMEYIPKQLPFQYFFWWDKYDERVTFHTRAENKDFIIAFKMLFNQLRHIEQCYRFPIILGLITVVMGSFAAVQSFIMYVEKSSAVGRAGTITGWVVATWFYILTMSILTDMFYRQIEQTKLICAYIQLKPSSSEMFTLTKNVLATLEVRDARVSLYDIVIFDTGLVFNVVASTFVYITVQLQLAFPNIEEGHKVDNVTRPVFELDRNTVKELMFLY